MKKLIIVVTCFYSAFSYGQEQDATSRRMRWTNLIQVGEIFDDNESVTGRFAGSWTSGIEINKLTTGVKLGYNDYDLFKVGSVSLYGKYRLFDKGFSPYGYGLVGYGNTVYFEDESQIDATNSDGGLLYGGGVGVSFPLGKIALLFQLGYKFQRVAYDEPDNYYYSDNYYSGNTKHTTRKMNRIEFKIGVQF